MWQAARPGCGRSALARAGESHLAVGSSQLQPVRLSSCERWGGQGHARPPAAAVPR